MSSQNHNELIALRKVIDVWKKAFSWKTVDGGSIITNPATEEMIANAEKALRRKLPETLLEIYRLSNGCEVVGGNIMIDRIISGSEGRGLPEIYAEGLKQASDAPEELILFGSDGSDVQYGLWIPRDSTRQITLPVVEIGDCDPNLIGIAATSIAKLMLGRTAYYLSLYEKSEAYRELGAPPELYGSDEEEDYRDMMLWADPDLPVELMDPFKSRISQDELPHLLAKLAKFNA